MKLSLLLPVAAVVFLAAGCDSPTRTITYKDGKLTMTEVRRPGQPTNWWELKEVPSQAEVKALRREGWKPADGTVGNSTIHLPGQPDQILVKRPMSPPPPVAKPAPFQPMLVTEFGAHTSSDGKWQIGVTETSLQFTHFILRDVAGATWTTATTTSPGRWVAHSNWCVFLESKTRAWSYDGDRQILVHTCSPDGSSSGQGPYDPDSPFPVPPQVLAHLSKDALSGLHRRAAN